MNNTVSLKKEISEFDLSYCLYTEAENNVLSLW